MASEMTWISFFRSTPRVSAHALIVLNPELLLAFVPEFRRLAENTQCFWVIVWRETGASAQATEGALAGRAYAGEMGRRKGNKDPTPNNAKKERDTLGWWRQRENGLGIRGFTLRCRTSRTSAGTESPKPVEHRHKDGVPYKLIYLPEVFDCDGLTQPAG
jgi:hypothetical protein